MIHKRETRDLEYYLDKHYPFVVYPAEEGGYVVEIEELPGCITQGETLEEVSERIENARQGWIETAYEDGLEIPLLRTENYVLQEKILAIEKRLTIIEATIPKERTVVLREVSKEEAEKDILELFSQSGILYYSDIAEQLRLDLKLVVEICNELQKRGEIQVVDDTLQRR